MDPVVRRWTSDHEGGPWRYDQEENVYRPQRLDSAIEAVYQDIELCGADRSTAYDTAYLSARNRRLWDQGWEVIM